MKKIFLLTAAFAFSVWPSLSKAAVECHANCYAVASPYWEYSVFLAPVKGSAPGNDLSPAYDQAIEDCRQHVANFLDRKKYYYLEYAPALLESFSHHGYHHARMEHICRPIAPAYGG